MEALEGLRSELLCNVTSKGAQSAHAAEGEGERATRAKKPSYQLTGQPCHKKER